MHAHSLAACDLRRRAEMRGLLGQRRPDNLWGEPRWLHVQDPMRIGRATCMDGQHMVLDTRDNLSLRSWNRILGLLRHAATSAAADSTDSAKRASATATTYRKRAVESAHLLGHRQQP
eukprot:8940976-Pyramimonas_sp.AAC.1